MKQVFLLLVVFSISINATAQKKNILIYTKNGKGYVHENISASVEALTKLCKENGYTSETSNDPSLFTPDKLKKFECIIFANTNNEGFDTEEQRQAFVEYIHKGGGFVGIHSASGSERQWPWFWSLLGGKFVRHPELQKFTLKVIDPNHPSTRFIKETWQWEDECYYTNNLNPDIHVVLAADLTTITDEKKAEYPGATFGNYFPIAWSHEFEGGRQFYTALGHKAAYYQDPVFLQHILGGIRWTLKEK